MPFEFKKTAPVRLRSLGLDERWLQNRVEDDSSLLGLGELDILRREKSQSSGGRLDFLMYDPESEIRYEIEMMLGELDESHIIRTIEYWDLERQRYPNADHRAVIVAEEITSRFFNVIRLLNRAVPLIAIQLNAFTLDNAVFLHFTKVLDVVEETEDTEEDGEQVDRKYWERKAGSAPLSVVDGVIALIERHIAPARLTYNKGHIALGTANFNFCWFYPRKSTPHCNMRLRVAPDRRAEVIQLMEDGGIAAFPGTRSYSIRFKLVPRQVEENQPALLSALKSGEMNSRRVSE